MGIIIIFLLISIVGLIFSNKGVTFEFLTILGIPTFITLILFAISTPNVSKFDLDYNDVKYESLLYRNANVLDNYNYLSKLTYRINAINKQIENNRKYANNFWIGCFYDENIGKYEIIVIEKELKKRITNI